MLEDYESATPKSKKLWARALKVFAGGVNHNIRTFGLDVCNSHPPFIARGEGSHLWDVDGNEYVDYWLTHYSAILGHNHPVIQKAIVDRAQDGHHLGALNEHQVEMAERMQDAIPFFEKMRFCSTGGEATMYAVRLARLFTGKPLVAKAFGGWHGGNDAVGYHIKHPYDDEPWYDGVTFNYNDKESVNRLLERHGEDIAAFIVEPVLGAGGGLPPRNGFLSYLREETEKRGIVLIFDEIITGFRLTYGSAGLNLFGVEPDLATFGKIAGGGMHLGAYGGREDIMQLAAPHSEGGRWVGGGTFSSHPLSMVAGSAALDELQKRRDDFSKLNDKGDQFREKINEILHDKGQSAISTGTGSIVFIHTLKDNIDPPLTGEKLGRLLDRKSLAEFQSKLIEKGVFGHHGLGALSFAHSEQDLEFTLDAIAEV